MQQIARNATTHGCGALRDCRYLLGDRDAKYSVGFRLIIEIARVKTLALPARIPNLNAYAERWMSVEDHFLRRTLVVSGRARVCCALP